MTDINTNNQITNELHLNSAEIIIIPQKYCKQCNAELPVSNNVRHTRFGLELCEDCLYN